MIRIKMSTSAAGAHARTFEINPNKIDLQGSADIVSIPTIYGANSHQQSSFDYRSRQLIFEHNIGYGATTTASPSMKAFVASARALLGQVVYFNFGDLAVINNSWSDGNTWKKTRLINVETEVAPNSNLRWTKIVVTIQPEV